MGFPPVDPRIETYMKALATRHDEPVLLEMEQLAQERHFPIIHRLCGSALEVLALSIGARTVFELGSGYGYSAYWFTRAVGPSGKVICTDGDAKNRDLAEGFLTRIGRWHQVDFHVGWAQKVLQATPGTFDIVYNDIDKDGYPEAWQLARNRVRSGGLYLCDNVLWSGNVTSPASSEDRRPEWTNAIREHNQMVFSDPDFDAFILPTRDGVLVARRR
jgi:predicted O-methyltransferase YrrM